MPTTTSTKNARDCAVYLDDENGVPVNISGSSNEVTIKRNRQIGDYTAFGDQETYRTEGNRDATVDLTIIFSKGAGEAMRLLKLWDDLGGARTLRFDVPGTPIDRFMPEVFMESFEINGKQDEPKPMMIKIATKVHGALNWSEV